jgi:hypothetical protein
VETVIRDQQAAYYRALGKADRTAEATPFISFMLEALQVALDEALRTDQPTDQVTDQAAARAQRLIEVIRKGEVLTLVELMARMGLSHAPTFRTNYLKPAIALGRIEMTEPQSPNSPSQRYRRVRR